jgi:alpha-L-fucosidase
LFLEGLAGRLEYAQFLHDASEVQFFAGSGSGRSANLEAAIPEGAVRLDLPAQPPDVLVPVVELFMKA